MFWSPPLTRRDRDNTLFRECLAEARSAVNRTHRGPQEERRRLALRKAKDLYAHIVREAKRYQQSRGYPAMDKQRRES